MLENGNYKAKATGVSFKTSKAGNNQVVVDFRLDNGESIMWTGTFSDNPRAVEIAVKALRACGWKDADLSELTVSMLSDEVELVIEQETYEGKTSARVKYVNQPGSLVFKQPLVGNDLKAFAASMKAKIAAISPVKSSNEEMPF